MKKHRTRISGVFAILCLLASKPTYGSLLYGVIFILAGESIRLWSSGHIHKNQILTVTGPYSLSRNPLYVGSFILGTGFFIAMGVIWFVIIYLIFFLVMYSLTIKWEEEKLERNFPNAWPSYRDNVPRFLPLFRAPAFSPGEFSWEQVKKHKELLNALVVLAAYAILWGKALLMRQ
jgi:protein-S-isoprenylcysteine O-methyltransferase Ste14